MANFYCRDRFMLDLTTSCCDCTPSENSAHLRCQFTFSHVRTAINNIYSLGVALENENIY